MQNPRIWRADYINAFFWQHQILPPFLFLFLLKQRLFGMTVDPWTTTSLNCPGLFLYVDFFSIKVRHPRIQPTVDGRWKTTREPRFVQSTDAEPACMEDWLWDFEHMWILASTVGPGTNFSWILTDNSVCSQFWEDSF